MKKGKTVMSFLMFGIATLTLVSVISQSQPVLSPSEVVKVEAAGTETPTQTPATTEVAKGSVPQDLMGKVTITNVDASEQSKKLGGATVKITEKNSGVEFTDIIDATGVLDFELPLGSYVVSQVKSADNYELDKNAYEFNLAVPENTDAGAIKSIHADVLMANTKAEPKVQLMSTTGSTATEKPVVKEVVPNPVTGDGSYVYFISSMVLFVFSVMVIGVLIALACRLHSLAWYKKRS